MDLSVVIPVKNEAGNIVPLVAEIAAALDGRALYEIIYVDDGSADSTAAEIRRLQASLPQLRLLRHDRSCGQSAARRANRTLPRARRSAAQATPMFKPSGPVVGEERCSC